MREGRGHDIVGSSNCLSADPISGHDLVWIKKRRGKGRRGR